MELPVLLVTLNASHARIPQESVRLAIRVTLPVEESVATPVLLAPIQVEILPALAAILTVLHAVMQLEFAASAMPTMNPMELLVLPLTQSPTTEVATVTAMKDFPLPPSLSSPLSSPSAFC